MLDYLITSSDDFISEPLHYIL